MKHAHALPWYQQATLYHIYPLSFGDADGDGYGDLRGIINRLDYLQDGTAESLGIGAIWLSPIYVSPMADWGYDVADYEAIDPRFGTMADFEELVREAHDRGMKILLDYVPNHTSQLHQWFIEARSSRDNPKRDWYIWGDPDRDGGPPNNWLSNFGGPAWTLDAVTGQYYLHTFLKEQPDLNWRNPDVRQAMLGVLNFWLDKGVDGFRTDAIYGLVKDAKFRDDPVNPNYRPGISNPSDQFLRLHSAGQSELNNVIGSFCDILAEREGKYLLSEAYLNIPALHHLYEACQKHPIHAPFNFNLMSLMWGAESFRSFIDDYEASLGESDWPNYVLGNHDRHRLASRVGHDKAKLLALLQLTLRGLPVVYYGDELGLEDGVVEPDQVRDPWGQQVPGHGLGRDVARTPMPWSAAAGSGFTTGTPWLPLGQDASVHNVAVEERQPDSSLHLYRHLIHLRQVSPALTTGRYRSLDLGSPYVFAYTRTEGRQHFLVVLNFDDKPADVMAHAEVGAWAAGTHLVEGDGLPPEGSVIRLRPYEGRLYELKGRVD